ncbi:hypothetical protein AWM75_04160 [Aerococcus urinaehominis]|uniref:Peptidase S9 prolyl oligopeptidase catalytic domain-containing protein n=1 Tax=Aerococcus urinaehominis TaxID=128944 RepID=A0A120IAV1_9LACT|nr:alpha/beta fold hydrolase [Aerococcus urinaehominis]AMB99249.1 hypothetical protein AWM75_04160 [Aerococcus urinaehominis]SDM31084.1 hypothetical protein SAMN04487985_1125 [Aerococcus urinaehominis]
MYQIIEKNIAGIPCLELVDKDLVQVALPLVIHFHGWQQNKEESLFVAIQLAAHGFRCLIPDALGHGDRYQDTENPAPDLFFQCLTQNVADYFTIKNFYQDQGLIRQNFIAASGLSMGGITVAMLMTQDPDLSAGSILMGTPCLVEFSQSLIDNVRKNLVAEQISASEFDQLNDKIISKLSPYDLSQQLEKIAGRPLLFWHGLKDDIIPLQQAEQVADQAKQQDYGRQVYFVGDFQTGHKVKTIQAYRQTRFFQYFCHGFAGDILKQLEIDLNQKFGRHKMASPAHKTFSF